MNPSEQAKSLAEGLESISDVITRSMMQENLYFRRWESNNNNNDREGFLPSHQGYRDTLKELYVRLLRFQATSVCYFSKNGALRLILDVTKWDDWGAMLEDIKDKDTAFRLTYQHLNDTKIEEEFEKLRIRHKESMNVLSTISSDVSGLRKAIEEAQNDKKRQELLKWLCLIDPSENYKKALSKHRAGTCGWFIETNVKFETWKTDPNSLLWLNGKGNSIHLHGQA